MGLKASSLFCEATTEVGTRRHGRKHTGRASPVAAPVAKEKHFLGRLLRTQQGRLGPQDGARNQTRELGISSSPHYSSDMERQGKGRKVVALLLVPPALAPSFLTVKGEGVFGRVSMHIKQPEGSQEERETFVCECHRKKDREFRDLSGGNTFSHGRIHC